MSNHVFVSHSHEDLPAADLVVQALEGRGITCWVAPRDVPAGGSYAEAILNAIESASCFVLIYSEHSNVSSHVLREVERALKFGVNIVPVRFDDSMPSKSLDYLLATVHWLSVVSDSRERSILKAAEQIAACVAQFQSTSPIAEQDRVPPPRTPVAPVASPPKRRLLWVGIAILLALLAGLIGYLVLRNPSYGQSAQKSEVAVSATTTRSATPAAAGPAQIDQTELPLAVTHRYFALLNKRNATAAYNLLSADFRRRLSIVKYSKNVGLTPPVKLVEATTVSKNERTASVTAVFEDTNPESRLGRWRGPIDFVLESGGWRIERMKGLWPASGRPMHDSANGSDDETTQDLSQSTSESTPAPQATPSPGPVHQAVHGIVQDPDGIANVREQPFIRAKIIAVVKNGERVEIDQMQGDWVHVVLSPGKGGFLHKSRVKITSE
jgi:TIR domain-containing protein/SH3 domain-containing protein